MFSSGQQYDIRARTGGADPEALYALLLQCGFDPSIYVEGHADLKSIGMDSAAGVVHFLVHGFDECRYVEFGPLGTGFSSLAGYSWPSRVYAAHLAESLFFAQLRHPGTEAILWSGEIGDVLEAVSDLGGQPYLILGDSHANHYRRNVRSHEGWLAPFPVACPGAPAGHLGTSTAPDALGQRMLALIERVAATQSEWNIPVLLKFGGLDTEFRWTLHRVRREISTFSDADFDQYMDRSLHGYGAFIDRLTQIIPPHQLHLCTVFPSVLPDRIWASRFSDMHGGGIDGVASLQAAVARLECQDLETRNRLRVRYNSGLRHMAEARRLGFIDDFTPLLDSSGMLDQRFAPRDPMDFHLDWDACGPELIPLLRIALGLP